MLRTRSPRKEKISNCYLHSNSLSNKMDNSLLAVRDINHKYIVVEIGEKGTCLSGGEKQRLALARLWFQDAELVVLDEATSAMDNLTEENVMKAVMHKLQEKTVIAIAHRLSSIADFDRIILFRDGQIVGQGSFEELMRTNAYFMELYHASMQS